MTDRAPGTAQTLPTQGLVNWIVRGLLRAPLISRGIGGRLLTLYVVGRKSGKRYTVPVAYTRHGDELLIGTPFGWARNLRTGDTVEVNFKGRRRTANVVAQADEASVVSAYEIIARDNRSFANFNKIGFLDDGRPDPGDLRLAWQAGARVLRLTF
jgi:deazaflavin-dependent oxidoreductase (nitroreductase family)